MSPQYGIFRWIWSIALLLFLVGGSPGAGTNASPDQLMNLAEAQVRADQPTEAASTYEKLIGLDPSLRQVLAGTLVKLYAGAGNSEKAIEWARVVMERNPDPQAYLAGVYTMLGQFKEARTILETEIAAATNAQRKVTLCWQTADLCEKSGNLAGTDKALNEAAKASAGLPEFSIAEQRLKAFRAAWK